MEPFSPYQTPASAPPPLPAHQALPRPGSVTAFGILNLLTPVLAACLQVVVIFAMRNRSQEVSPIMQVPGVRATYLLVIPALFLTGGLMFGSGWALLRGSRRALLWTNLYGLISVLTKAAYLVMSILILIPARLAMAKTTTAVTGRGASYGAQVFGAIFITVIPTIYPLLAVSLLNSRAVKSWLASRAEARGHGIA